MTPSTATPALTAQQVADLRSALPYVDGWLAYRRWRERVPGVQTAIWFDGGLQLSSAHGLADEEARVPLFELLSSGSALLPVWESLDLAGCIIRWFPAWQGISARPQHNPVHRHTVDRHSVQCVAEVQRHLTQVERPDLLLLACLLHDIGKLPGAGAAHPVVGAPVARRIAMDVGLPDADAELVERLVREHLTLADLATRRDHGDPATVDALVAAVDGRLETLQMLRFVTEADAKAAGLLALAV